MPDDLVSVVIPTHDRAAVVCRAIDSALAQRGVDVEVIVVDDDSGDAESPGVRARAANPRVRVITRPSQGGASAARNTGIDAAHGTFVAFLDSDDVWLRDKLSRQVGTLRRNPGSGLDLCGFVVFDERGSRRALPSASRKGDVTRYLALRQGPTVTSCFVLPRHVVEQGFRFDDHLPALEDFDLAMRINEQYDVSVTREYLVRKHASSERLFSGPRIAEAREAFIRKHFDALAASPRMLERQRIRLALDLVAAGERDKSREELLTACRERRLVGALLRNSTVAPVTTRWITSLSRLRLANAPRLRTRVLDVVRPVRSFVDD